jgi:hypothetical protein
MTPVDGGQVTQPAHCECDVGIRQLRRVFRCAVVTPLLEHHGNGSEHETHPDGGVVLIKAELRHGQRREVADGRVVPPALEVSLAAGAYPTVVFKARTLADGLHSRTNTGPSPSLWPPEKLNVPPPPGSVTCVSVSAPLAKV